jgi:hypothetical protein
MLGAEIEVVPATWLLGAAVAGRMRAADRDEVWALHRHTPREAIERSMDQSRECWVAKVDGVPMAVFGCATYRMMPEVGAPWLLAAEGIERHPGALVKMGRSYVARWLRHYEQLANIVDVRNATSIAWLRRLGFTVDETPLRVGPDNEPALAFCRPPYEPRRPYEPRPPREPRKARPNV